MLTLLSSLLELLGPLLVGLLTVPIMGLVKQAVGFLDSMPAAVQQIVAVLIAFGLTQLGGLANTILPEGLALFTGADIEALLSAGIAFAVHAGKKAAG